MYIPFVKMSLVLENIQDKNHFQEIIQVINEVYIIVHNNVIISKISFTSKINCLKKKLNYPYFFHIQM